MLGARVGSSVGFADGIDVDGTTVGSSVGILVGMLEVDVTA